MFPFLQRLCSPHTTRVSRYGCSYRREFSHFFWKTAGNCSQERPNRAELAECLQPATSSTLSPSMGCVISGGNYTRSGFRHLRQLAATQPLRVPAHLASTILAQRMWTKKWTMPQDSLGFAFFFATYEAVKQSILPHAVNAMSSSTLNDSEIVVSASTAFVAGASAGGVYSLVKTPIQWRTDFQVSLGQRMLSHEFARHLSSSVLKQSLPNAASFLVIELLMHYLNLK